MNGQHEPSSITWSLFRTTFPTTIDIDSAHYGERIIEGEINGNPYRESIPDADWMCVSSRGWPHRRQSDIYAEVMVDGYFHEGFDLYGIEYSMTSVRMDWVAPMLGNYSLIKDVAFNEINTQAGFVDDIRILRNKKPIFVRCESRSQMSICDRCGYRYCLLTEDQWFLGDDVTEEDVIFESLFGICIRSDLLSKPGVRNPLSVWPVRTLPWYPDRPLSNIVGLDLPAR